MDGKEKEIMNLLTEFLVVNINEKVLQGISYIIVPKNDKNNEKIKELDKVRARLTELGVPENEQFRRYDVNTGVIYEIDLKTAIELTVRISKAAGASESTDFGISQSSYERQNDDIKRFAQLCVKKAKAGIEEFDVCLFSRNTVDKINMTGKDQNNKDIMVAYDAFALRHTDIAKINQQLANVHLKIVRVIIHEAVPSMTGVRTTIGIVYIK